MADPRVEALKGLVARYVAAGADYNDCQRIFAQMQTWDDWCRAWSAMGRTHEELAQSALGQGHRVTAGEAWARAAIYYHFGKFLFLHDPQQHQRAHEATVRCYQRAAPLLAPPAERVQIPYARTRMAGYLRRPRGTQRPPVAILIPGLDATKEELHSFTEVFLRRGLATLCFDGPGQGESAAALPTRPDYEGAVSAALDWLQDREDVNADAVGVVGVSLGGYYAVRAAALEPRVKAAVTVCGPFEWGNCWQALPSLSRQALRLSAGLQTEEQARRLVGEFTLAGLAEDIRCPLLIIQSRADPRIPPEEKERLAREVRCPHQLVLYEDGDHVCHNLSYQYRPLVADWLGETLNNVV